MVDKLEEDICLSPRAQRQTQLGESPVYKKAELAAGHLGTYRIGLALVQDR